MAEKHLDCAEIRAGFEQMSCETMPQSVHCNVLDQASVFAARTQILCTAFTVMGLSGTSPGKSQLVGRTIFQFRAAARATAAKA